MQTLPATTLTPDDRFAEIQQRAYQLWEDARRPEGDDLTFWLLAEAEVNGSRQETAAAPPSAAAAVRRNEGMAAALNRPAARARKALNRSSALPAGVARAS